MNYKVGLLVTKSILYPAMNFDLLKGLKTGLAQNGANDIEIKTENIDLGANEKMIYSACEKLLFEGASIVAGYMNANIIEKLEPLFAAANGILVVLDSGMHLPLSMKRLPHVFVLSLQGALCARTITRHAIADNIKSFAYSSSYYDSGYRACFAFSKALEEGGGGITYNHITPLKRNEFSLDPLALFLEQPGSDGIFAAFCGDMTEDFFGGLSSKEIFKNYSIYGSSFLGEEDWLERCTYPGMDIKVCVPWATGLGNETNSRFIEALKQQRQRPNIFSMLAWEAGAVMAETARTSGTSESIIALEGFSFESPRGKVTISGATHFSHAPVYEARIQRNENTGNCRLVVGGPSEYTNEQRQKLENDIANFPGPFTSWFNAYGCLES